MLLRFTDKEGVYLSKTAAYFMEVFTVDERTYASLRISGNGGRHVGLKETEEGWEGDGVRLVRVLAGFKLYLS